MPRYTSPTKFSSALDACAARTAGVLWSTAQGRAWGATGLCLVEVVQVVAVRVELALRLRACVQQQHTRTHTCTHARTRTLTHSHSLTHTCTHARTLTHTHAHTHTHTRTHTHTHAHAPTAAICARNASPTHSFAAPSLCPSCVFGATLNPVISSLIPINRLPFSAARAQVTTHSAPACSDASLARGRDSALPHLRRDWNPHRRVDWVAHLRPTTSASGLDPSVPTSAPGTWRTLTRTSQQARAYCARLMPPLGVCLIAPCSFPFRPVPCAAEGAALECTRTLLGSGDSIRRKHTGTHARARTHTHARARTHTHAHARTRTRARNRRRAFATLVRIARLRGGPPLPSAASPPVPHARHGLDSSTSAHICAGTDWAPPGPHLRRD
jgi:hypothetical protein